MNTQMSDAATQDATLTARQFYRKSDLYSSGLLESTNITILVSRD